MSSAGWSWVPLSRRRRKVRHRAGQSGRQERAMARRGGSPPDGGFEVELVVVGEANQVLLAGLRFDRPAVCRSSVGGPPLDEDLDRDLDVADTPTALGWRLVVRSAMTSRPRFVRASRTGPRSGRPGGGRTEIDRDAGDW